MQATSDRLATRIELFLRANPGSRTSCHSLRSPSDRQSVHECFDDPLDVTIREIVVEGESKEA